MLWKTFAVGLYALMLVLAGCSSSEEAAKREPGKDDTGTSTDAASRDRALQHFIDASLYEMKGDYAKAVLEYQDALRYDKNHAIYFALAKNYSALNKHSLAIEAGKEAVRLAPENLDYRKTLADVYIAAFEIDKAAEEYEQIVRRDSTSLESWYNLARLYQGRKPLKALEVYNSIIRRFGAEWEVLLQIAEMHNQMGEYEKAAAAMKKMLEIDPGNLELKHSVAQSYMRAGKFDEALALLHELREINPANIEYIGDIAGIHLRRKEYAKAAEQFERILEQDSVAIEAKLRIGELYFGQMESDSTLAPIAQSIFERILEHHPDDWRPHWFLGAIGAVTGNDSLSVSNFRKVTELAGWNADGWVYLSSVFLEKNNYAEVEKVLESAIKVLPDDFRVNFFLGVAYNQLGKKQEAIRVLEHARTLNPKDVNAISQLALVYDGLDRHDETDRLYEEGLTLDPENHLMLNNYSYSLAERNLNLQRALEMARKAIEAQPENQAYLDTIGWVYYQLGNYKLAEEFIAKAIGMGNASAVLHEHLGDIYYRMNDRDRALEQWRIGLKLDEENQELREKVERGTL